ELAIARTASHHGARPAEVDHASGDRTARTTVRAGNDDVRLLAAEHRQQQPADRVPVHRLHQVPPIPPNRSVRTRRGGYPRLVSAPATFSTNGVGPQTNASGSRDT